MNGPDHYAESESLLSKANAIDVNDPWYLGTILSAQTHATLALAAATIDAAMWQPGNVRAHQWIAVVNAGSSMEATPE